MGRWIPSGRAAPSRGLRSGEFVRRVVGALPALLLAIAVAEFILLVLH